MPRSKTKAQGQQNWTVQVLRTGALILIFEKIYISHRVLNEHKEFSCNFLFCVLKCFSFTAIFIISEMLIKWISRCLFIENVSCCDWLTQNLLLHYLTSRWRFFLPTFYTRVSPLWCCHLRVFARLARWQFMLLLFLLLLSFKYSFKTNFIFQAPIYIKSLCLTYIS